MPLFQVPHKRPTHLSDPFHDYGQGWLLGLLETPDACLKWSDFQTLFGPILPAGTYDETAYFLPLAFDFLLADRESANEVINPLVGFISKNVDNLEKDELLQPCRAAIHHCLRHWTKNFQVLDEPLNPDTSGKDWRLPRFGTVKHSDHVLETLSCLTHYKTQADLAVQFIADLAANLHQPTHAGWFLELAAKQTGRFTFFTIKDPRVLELLQSPSSLKRAADTVYDNDIKNNWNINHWTAVFYILGL